MKSVLKIFKRKVVTLDFLSIALVFTAIVIAVLLYRHKFSGDLSDTSGDWSNFGSFIGGVFGPLISFVTLIAILKTISLQKELLDTQRQEFASMQDLQVRTFESQQSQIDEANQISNFQRVQRLKDSLLGSLDRNIQIFDSRYDRAFRRYERYKDFENKRNQGISSDLYKEVELSMRMNENKITLLEKLAAEITFNDFLEENVLRDFYAQRIKSIV